MPLDRLDQAQQLIDAGKYDQARRILGKLNTPAARNLLQDLDEIDPPDPDRWGFGDYLHTLLIGVLAAALFGAIGFGVATAIGIPRSVTPVQATLAPGATAVAIVATITPTPSPTPTEIPCLAAEWWATNQPIFSDTVATLFGMSVDTPVPELQKAETDFSAWVTSLETNPPAACLITTQQAISKSAQPVRAAFESYTTVSTISIRAQAFISAMDALLVVADELTALNVNAEKDEAVRIVTLYTRSDCPVYRWYHEHVEAPGYDRFITEMDALNFNAVAEAQQHLRTMQSLRSSFATENATVPACLESVRTYFLEFMDGQIAFSNDMLSGDAAKADQSLKKGEAAYASYMVEMERLNNAALQEFKAGTTS